MILSGATAYVAPVLAVDIGATKIDVAVAETDGSLRDRRRLLLAGRDDIASALVSLVRDMASTHQVAAIGVGCAGPMTDHGATVSPVNIDQWREFPLRDVLCEGTGLDVFIEGDARALALAEGAVGAARGQRSYLSMVVSSGIGGGIVLNGGLLDGESGNAGHVGHLTVVPGGRRCHCRSRGCLEAEASGIAIEAMTGRPPREADDSMRRQVGELVGRAVGTLASVLDFSKCYVAGSVALGYGDVFFQSANDAATCVSTMPYTRNLTIERSGLYADGPLLGAAHVGWRGVES